MNARGGLGALARASGQFGRELALLGLRGSGTIFGVATRVATPGFVIAFYSLQASETAWWDCIKGFLPLVLSPANWEDK